MVAYPLIMIGTWEIVAIESYLTIELRTASGTAMRIQGCMTAAHLREIISAG